ncbi:MAG: SUMF1/EgtB/PvdO family nonheme iron enzyme [Bacteroidales bacterium]|nr:SUMF1/EgtB/PvdO family nonheme iron enzyme [Bacteroidales bacterium]
MKHLNLINTSDTCISVERKRWRKCSSNSQSAKKELLHKKWAVSLVSLCFFLSISNFIYGSGVVLNNLSLIEQNPTQKYTHLKFDIKWYNSWRTSSPPYNWDACWVFAKYRKKAQYTWHHATLNYVDGTGSGDGHTAPTGSTINTTPDGKGIMIYSSSNISSQTADYAGVKLRWNYGADGLVNEDSVEIIVFAIEMVYVPQGSFYVGDGTTNYVCGHFRQRASNAPFRISSENQITLGGTGSGSLNNNNAKTMAHNADDFNNTTSKILPAAFPKGYNSFYCMKYAISQEQYVLFLNTITREQQNARTSTNLAAGVTAVTNRYVMSNSSAIQYRNGIRCDGTIHATNPITFYCDFNGNGIPNEAGDGINIPCNYMSWGDLAAYLDWAALRPMTELEFEKACRGNQPPVIGEYAWGSTEITPATGILSSGFFNEFASSNAANAVCGNNTQVQGPMRVGCLGKGVNTRKGVGASFYGIMNMSGNHWERTVTIGNDAGRAFTGMHGDGVLAASGDADVSNWPNATGEGVGFRGGSWKDAGFILSVSCRLFATYISDARGNLWSYRGVRVCPVR